MKKATLSLIALADLAGNAFASEPTASIRCVVAATKLRCKRKAARRPGAPCERSSRRCGNRRAQGALKRCGSLQARPSRRTLREASFFSARISAFACWALSSPGVGWYSRTVPHLPYISRNMSRTRRRNTPFPKWFGKRFTRCSPIWPGCHRRW